MSADRLAVRARGLTKHYDDLTAVDQIDIDIPAGECFGFLGPNGAGKSTTMRMMSCLTRRDGGQLEVLGLDPDDSPAALKAQLGVVAQETNLDMELTVRQNLLVWARYFDISGASARARADETLHNMSLADRADRPVRTLSGACSAVCRLAGP